MALGGVRPNSGRKSGIDELIKCLVINKSWDRILKKFNKEDELAKKHKTDDKLDKQLDIISLEVAKKTIPTKIEGDINIINISKILDAKE